MQLVTSSCRTRRDPACVCKARAPALRLSGSLPPAPALRIASICRTMCVHDGETIEIRPNPKSQRTRTGRRRA